MTPEAIERINKLHPEDSLNVELSIFERDENGDVRGDSRPVCTAGEVQRLTASLTDALKDLEAAKGLSQKLVNVSDQVHSFINTRTQCDCFAPPKNEKPQTCGRCVLMDSFYSAAHDLQAYLDALHTSSDSEKNDKGEK